jgi:hypothetical protein
MKDEHVRARHQILDLIFFALLSAESSRWPQLGSGPADEAAGKKGRSVCRAQP